MTQEFQDNRIQPTNINREAMTRQAVEASIERIHQATRDLPLGLSTAWRLPTRRQQLGTTCFFSGPIQIAEASGRQISERQLAEAATAQGLLNQGGAVTYDPEKRALMEKFVYEQTEVRIRHNEPTMPEGMPQEIDLRLLKCVTQDYNLALLLYPLPRFDQAGYWNGRGEWVTLYGVEKTPKDVLFYMTFSGSGERGIVETLDAAQMARRLYGVPGGHAEIWAIEIQTHYPDRPVTPTTDLFAQAAPTADDLFKPAGKNQAVDPNLFRPAKE
ncbi:hypothetical protein HYT18_04320 [Candidatus Microgenomates bacterium]|nr:hypothetical protein [Candidatus Microgenomates bacterium]